MRCRLRVFVVFSVCDAEHVHLFSIDRFVVLRASQNVFLGV